MNNHKVTPQYPFLSDTLVPSLADAGLTKHPRCNVLGVHISAIGMEEAVGLADRHIRQGKKGYVCVTGVHGVMEAQSDPGFRHVLNTATITVPDGMPTVWVGAMQGHAGMSRVYGPDFMLELCRLSVSRGYTQFLYGGNSGVADQLATMLMTRFSGLRVVGTFTPPFRPLNSEEEAELIHQVTTLKPDILWVGLSTPKQEKFMAAYLEKLDTRLMIGVGAAFDIHTGKIADAPLWIKAIGLQWLHRLFQEPKRLWKRYLINNPRFLFSIGMQLLGIRRYSTELSDPIATPEFQTGNLGQGSATLDDVPITDHTARQKPAHNTPEVCRQPHAHRHTSFAADNDETSQGGK